MNILIPYGWLKDFVKTEATPSEIAEKLSLCAFSVEKTTQTDDGDTLFEIEVTPNRPDALSVLGIAREVGAILPQFEIAAEFKDNVQDFIIKKPSNPLELGITIKNSKLCPRFTALILKNIKVGKSPAEMVKRLEKVGLRSLNNVIDITNYIMIERGQPMHVFDYDKLAAISGQQSAYSRKKMTLRESRVGEKIITLDGQKRKLPKGAIIIEDGEKIIDLCGIMGGANSCVDENTTRVILFVQIYDPVRIRKTTQKMGFRTDASSRFEKGMDPRGVTLALKQAANFLIKEAGGKIASDLIDIENQSYKNHQITITVEQIENLLGTRIEPDKITEILKSLGFEVLWTTGPSDITSAPEIKVTAPSWRANDISITEDIIEEIARIYGYHNLPNNLPPLPKELGDEENIFYWEKRTHNVLKGCGFLETYNYSFISRNTLEKAGFDPEHTLKLKNPLNEDLTHLRPSILPQLLETAAGNQVQRKEQRLFQLERVFLPQKGRELPKEPQNLTGLIYSAIEKTENLFYEAKGVIEVLLWELGIEDYSFSAVGQRQSANGNTWNPTLSAKIGIGSLKVGTLGAVDSIILSNFGIEGQLVAIELDFEKLANIATTNKIFEPPSAHPPIIEDLTFEVGERVPTGKIAKEIKNQKSKIKNVKIKTEIKNVYRDRNLIKQREKAVTFGIIYQSKGEALSDEKVAPIRERIIKKIEKEFGARLRGKYPTTPNQLELS